MPKLWHQGPTQVSEMTLPIKVSAGFALRYPRPTSEDSNRLSPRGLATRPRFCKVSVHGRFTSVSSSPWLYIQSEALQHRLPPNGDASARIG